MSGILRCSYLPFYNDCPKRSAAKMFMADLMERGYEIRKKPSRASAHVGTGSHAGFAVLLKQKVDGAGCDIEPAVVASKQKYAERAAEDGVEYNPKDIASEDVSHTVMQGLVGFYARHVLPLRKPLFVEQTMVVPIGDDFMLEGTPDMVETDLNVDDNKTGKNLPIADAQIGGYILQLEDQGLKPKGGTVTWIRRGTKTNPTPTVQVIHIEKQQARNAALRTIRDIKEHKQKFDRLSPATGDRDAFPENPTSNLCNAKDCALFGTEGFCDRWKQKVLMEGGE